MEKLEKINKAATETFEYVQKCAMDLAEFYNVNVYVVIRDLKDVSQENKNGKVVCIEFKD